MCKSVDNRLLCTVKQFLNKLVFHINPLLLYHAVDLLNKLYSSQNQKIYHIIMFIISQQFQDNEKIKKIYLTITNIMV